MIILFPNTQYHPSASRFQPSHRRDPAAPPNAKPLPTPPPLFWIQGDAARAAPPSPRPKDSRSSAGNPRPRHEHSVCAPVSQTTQPTPSRNHITTIVGTYCPGYSPDLLGDPHHGPHRRDLGAPPPEDPPPAVLPPSAWENPLGGTTRYRSCSVAAVRGALRAARCMRRAPPHPHTTRHTRRAGGAAPRPPPLMRRTTTASRASASPMFPSCPEQTQNPQPGM